MQSILDAINEWIKEILIGAINGNLSTMFGDVNEKVGTIEVRPCYQGIFHHSHSSAAYSFANSSGQRTSQRVCSASKVQAVRANSF